MIDKELFDRQILLFGEEGQAKIEQAAVAIVGLGGLGSHVTQQLAYLGVRKYALIDRDWTSRSNLNRLIGATEVDATQKILKVEVAARQISLVRPKAQIDPIPYSLISIEGFESVRRADFVFGCVDRDAVRLILTELCAAYQRTYLDAATDIKTDEQGVLFGGRLVLSYEGRQCLFCLDELDQADIRRDLATPEQRAEDAKIYGVRRDAAGERGPAVVSLNGVVASLAVTEFLAFVTGIRPVFPHLVYDGRSGGVRPDTTPPLPKCPYCKISYGRGEAAKVERYIEAGLGNYL